MSVSKTLFFHPFPAALCSVAALCMLLTGCATPRLRPLSSGTAVTREFADELGRRMGAPMVESNRVTTLINGNEIFPAMLREIREATNSITFENFIWRSGALSEVSDAESLESISATSASETPSAIEICRRMATFDVRALDEQHVEQQHRRCQCEESQYIKFEPTAQFLILEQGYRPDSDLGEPV